MVGEELVEGPTGGDGVAVEDIFDGTHRWPEGAEPLDFGVAGIGGEEFQDAVDVLFFEHGRSSIFHKIRNFLVVIIPAGDLWRGRNFGF